MPIIDKTHQDDVFSAGAHAIVNPVNCVGVSGMGLALKFKQDFPENFNRYRAYCQDGLLQPGGIFFTQEAMPSAPDGKVYIVNLATKDHWQNPSKIEWIEAGVSLLRAWAEEFKVKSIACPAIGSGLGQMIWADVEKIIKKEFENSNVEIYVYPPKIGPAYGSNRSKFKP